MNRDEVSLRTRTSFGGQPASGHSQHPPPRLLLPQEPHRGTVTPLLPFGEKGPPGVAGLVWVHTAAQDGAQTGLMGCHLQCACHWLDKTSVTCGCLRSAGARDGARWIWGGAESLRPPMGLRRAVGPLPPALPDPAQGLRGKVCPLLTPVHPGPPRGGRDTPEQACQQWDGSAVAPPTSSRTPHSWGPPVSCVRLYFTI